MIKALTDDQYSIFMTNLANIHIRDQCIMLFMLHGGLRNGEVCKLRWTDICISRQVFHTIHIINGHSRKKTSRYVTLSPKLIEVIRDYLSWYDKQYGYTDSWHDKRYGYINQNRHVFITRNQKINIQQRDVHRIVTGYTKKHLQDTFTPHSLRHTFATRLLRCSNIRVVQQLLGHGSLISTEIYTHPNSEDRKNAINQAF